jgi:phospholipase/lecithinase/hemolysin
MEEIEMKVAVLARGVWLVLACAVGATPALASPFTGLYVFGDSLSDVGNVFLATGGAVPGAPYFSGRFSNGPNWVDDLSQALGLGAVQPALAGGTDFAFGGAVTGPAVPGATTTVPNVVQQIGLFSVATGGHAPSTGLNAVWIGANDIFTALDGLLANTLTAAQAKADLTAAAQTAAGAVDALADEGATTFLIPLIPDIGKTPDARDAGVATVATDLTDGYNAALVAAIQGLTSGDKITVHYLDTVAPIDAAVNDPAAFGYTDVTDRCYVGSLGGGGTACATPDSYLFWDGQHPTAISHALIAAAAAEAIPEPPAALILLTAICAMLGLRVRSMSSGCTRRAEAM